MTPFGMAWHSRSLMENPTVNIPYTLPLQSVLISRVAENPKTETPYTLPLGSARFISRVCMTIKYRLWVPVFLLCPGSDYLMIC